MKAPRRNNVEAARDLRQRMTPAEAMAWQILRDRRLAGVKFRRQHPVGPYVLDFCCASLRLAIELDGGVHDHQQEDDEYRQRELAAFGYRVLRFSNEMVLQEPEWFLERVAEAVATLTPGPSPGARERGVPSDSRAPSSGPWPREAGQRGRE